MIDAPKSLGNPGHRAELLAQLCAPHISEFTVFVERIRVNLGAGTKCRTSIPLTAESPPSASMFWRPPGQELSQAASSRATILTKPPRTGLS